MEEIQFSRFNPITMIRTLIKYAIMLLFVVIVVSVFYQVVARYVFQAPPSWTEEVSRFSLVWLIMLGSSVCIRKGRHFNVDYITHAMSKKTVFFLNLTLYLLILFFLSYVFNFGIQIMTRSFQITSPALGLKMGYVLMIFPIGGGAMILETVIILFDMIRTGIKDYKPDHGDKSTQY